MSYSYLDGTVAGGLLQGQQSVPGNYVPGQGTAPYSPYSNVTQGAISGAQYPAGTQSAVGGAISGAQMRDIYGRYVLPSNWAIGAYAGGTPGVSGSAVQQSGIPAAAISGSTGTTIIGQQSPEEIARNNAIMNAPVGGTSSSGGGSGGGSGASGTGTPAAPSGVLSGPSQPGASTSPGNFSGVSIPNGSPITYQSPQGQMGSPAGYQAPPGQSGSAGSGSLMMQQSNPQNAINAYQNTAGYQMLGNDQTNQYQASPGYQYAVNEALGQVQRNASSRGLLESGRVMRDMTDRAQGMAQQDYGNWWNRQNQLYGDYQNRLAGLAGGSTGSDQAYNLGQTLGASTDQMGANLANIYGNQGSGVFGAITNTGAALANSVQQAGNQQAQINAANQSTRLAGAASGYY